MKDALPFSGGRNDYDFLVSKPGQYEISVSDGYVVSLASFDEEDYREGQSFVTDLDLRKDEYYSLYVQEAGSMIDLSYTLNIKYLGKAETEDITEEIKETETTQTEAEVANHTELELRLDALEDEQAQLRQMLEEENEKLRQALDELGIAFD